MRVILALAMSLGMASSFAAIAVAQEPASDPPIDVTGHRFEWIPRERTVIVTGDAATGDPLAIRGDAQITVQQFRVLLSDDGEAEAASPADSTQSGTDFQGDIERIFAEGRVRYRTPDEVATGDDAVYDASLRTITLTGSVVVTRGPNVMRGGKLVIDIDSGRSIMERAADGDRVRGLFFSGSGSGVDG